MFRDSIMSVGTPENNRNQNKLIQMVSEKVENKLQNMSNRKSLVGSSFECDGKMNLTNM